MEKRLRSSLKTSADEFISTAIKLSLKTSKAALKSIIYAVKPSSDLSSSLPLALHKSIHQHTESFQKLDDDDDTTTPYVPSPSNSPPPKRQRVGSVLDSGQRKQEILLSSLEVLSHAVHLCLLNPKKAFSTSDLLPAAQFLHDNLRLFESDSVLCLEIAGICECWWKEGLVGRESLISQSLPFLLSRSLTLKKKVDVHRVYMLREAFTLFDFEDESIEDLRMLLMRCVVSPLYVKTEDGQRFVSFAFGLSRQLMKAGLAVVKAQIPLARKSVLEGFGGILFRAWKEVEQQDLKGEIEDGFLQGIIDTCIHASSCAFSASLRRVLEGFISQRTTQGVEKLLFSLAEPMIFRSLQVANSNVRLNALHLLLDLFPMEDPDATKEAKDSLLDKQFYLLEKLMSDECPDVRSVAVEGLCRVFYLFWEVIPSATITKVLTKIFDDMSHESCSEVRLSTVNGITYLLANPQSHGILKVVLPRLGHLMLDSVTSVRVAMVDLLLLLRDVRAFQDPKVWEEPMAFNPERFIGAQEESVDITGSRGIKMMPFGAGRRICPGIGLAMLHLEYYVANMVREFEWKEVQGHEVDLTEKLEFTVVMKHPLKALAVPRRNY
ncbi:PREDICTED: condensin-2 complex subunit G2-like [Camelina sativa]|uniref:Condensin-2 complex subunit G2-like n=1 Tax=Camelina sativa TaxID=90675 RepID=A0ABM1QLF6_CAMSA|nr:PREDICTED: condensin-2 complex subunit G2-like [Camelina sativa]